MGCNTEFKRTTSRDGVTVKGQVTMLLANNQEMCGIIKFQCLRNLISRVVSVTCVNAGTLEEFGQTDIADVIATRSQ